MDEHSYPTLKHFLRDIEQMIHNAREYNPLTLKDQRGRVIVHSANSMVDIVESHAYNFCKEAGYNVFKRCEDIHRRLAGERPLPISNAIRVSSTPDAKYYKEIIALHEKVREEQGEEHPTAVRLREAVEGPRWEGGGDEGGDGGRDGGLGVALNSPAANGSIRRSKRGSDEGLLSDLPFPARKKSKAASPPKLAASEVVMLDSDDETMDRAAATGNTDGDALVTEKDSIAVADLEGAIESKEDDKVEVASAAAEEAAIVVDEGDIDRFESMMKLKESIRVAGSTGSDLYATFTRKSVAITEGMSIASIITLVTSLNRLTHDFIGHLDFALLIARINDEIDKLEQV